jgi:hypothetical protein
MFSGIKHWDLIVMFALLATIFIFELLGVFNPKMITITAIIKDFVPIPCRVMVLAWLVWHFFISDIVKQLKPV